MPQGRNTRRFNTQGFNAQGSRLVITALIACLGLTPFSAAANCPSPGEWWQAQQVVSHSALLTQAAQQQVVLLGEQHDAIDHHRWQLSTLAGLHALRENMVIGLEMLPRSTQPVLDNWVAGALSEEELLEQTQWQETWGFDSELYLPILHFARLHQIPLVALNITPDLRRRLVEEGFANIPSDQRHGIPAPLTASNTYKERLQQAFEQHAMDVNDPEQLTRFIDAQLSWDVAMAHGLAQATEDGALTVGLMGLGHVVYNEGVAHQLSGMGVERSLSLLPWERQHCETPPPALADAVFILPAQPKESD